MIPASNERKETKMNFFKNLFTRNAEIAAWESDIAEIAELLERAKSARHGHGYFIRADRKAEQVAARHGVAASYVLAAARAW